MNSGRMRCWGDNGAGQLGNGTQTDVPTPPTHDVLVDVRAIATSATHTCALTTEGGGRCWGNGWHGELGDSGHSDVRPTPATAVETCN
jgi:alpha-tubulin suppressor-like RCC1 family protein